MLDSVSLLNMAPERLRRRAYAVAAGHGPLGHLADLLRFRYSRTDIPQLPAVASTPCRLVIGPANSAGQAYQWGRAAERFRTDTHAVTVYGIGADPFQLEADVRVPVSVYQRSPEWHDAFETFLSGQTRVIWESGLPLLGRRYASDVLREAAALSHGGVRGALVFHGSDIRPPSRHAAVSPWSPFAQPTGATRALEDGAARNAELAQRSGLPVFVSTPDMLQWVPGATWLPVVVDSARWAVAPKEGSRARVPVVAHAPSQRWLKGTDLIEPMLRRLAEEGVIEYRQILGVAHSTMPAFYAAADIVIDQVVLGIYGVAACEAMAAGKLVMSHVDEFTRRTVHERTGLELPVHESTIDTLEADLRRAAADPASFDHLRVAGPAFVESVHDGRRSAQALAPFLATE